MQENIFYIFLYLWWLATAADGVGLLLAGVRLHTISKSGRLTRSTRQFCIIFYRLLFSFAFEAFLIVFADIFLSHGVTLIFIITRLIGRTVKGGFTWQFVFSFLGLREGHESIHATSISGDKSKG